VRYGLVAYRLFFGLLTLFAIGRQFVIHLEAGYDPVNFFSYFTNLSNIFAAIVFLAGAYRVILGRPTTASFDIVRGMAAICMAVVGIVFSVLLRNEDLGNLLPWVNAVLHYLMPIAVVTDWVFQPPETRLYLRYVGFWLLFPLFYLAYSIIRGAAVGFYAYPFFDPAKSGGYSGVAVYCLGILLLFLVLSWLFVALGNALRQNDRVAAVHL
jgi:hypothetical protein